MLPSNVWSYNLYYDCLKVPEVLRGQQIKVIHTVYCKVASINTSSLEVSSRFYRLLMSIYCDLLRKT